MLPDLPDMGILSPQGPAFCCCCLNQGNRRESERRTFWEVFVPPTVARRVGPAWVLVRYGDSLAQRLAFLEALHITKLRLPT